MQHSVTQVLSHHPHFPELCAEKTKGATGLFHSKTSSSGGKPVFPGNEQVIDPVDGESKRSSRLAVINVRSVLVTCPSPDPQKNPYSKMEEQDKSGPGRTNGNPRSFVRQVLSVNCLMTGLRDTVAVEPR